ncbi:MAG: sulfotransferase [Caldilineaceae bacterium]
MTNELKPPIILFGNTRSGTTIVQKVLDVHPDVAGWYEPRTMWLCADPGRRHDEFDASDVTPKVRDYVHKQFLKFQKQNGNCIVMEKTPANILKIPYVREIFPDATFMFIVRNPFSFISSVEMKWQKPVTNKGIKRRLEFTPVSQLHHYAGRLIRDQFYKKVLKRKYLAVWGPRYNGIEEDLKTTDLLTVIARQWAIPSRKAARDLAQFAPDQVLGLKYEEFVTDPVADMERICAHCGLQLTNEMVKAATDWVKPDRQDKWRRFDPEQLARIVPEIAGEMQRHGYEMPVEITEAIQNLRQEERMPTGNLVGQAS